MISENTLKARDLKPSMFLFTIGSRNVKRDENASASFGLLYLQKMGSTSQIWIINVSYFLAFVREKAGLR